ncbi:hypothetical protein PBRA_006931 [Plasmodiophora brassicae]|uniref:SAP domain-containing protein n=1 Tax=Plasmodiophora brassicae TaxID=37360 RepID=A0A0G4IUA6_PLABS|nr:hypothetical protein PBRA_006931 [Plasmodiophora brassicae]
MEGEGGASGADRRARRRALQALCKEHGLKAVGTTSDLSQRLSDHLERMNSAPQTPVRSDKRKRRVSFSPYHNRRPHPANQIETGLDPMRKKAVTSGASGYATSGLN